MLKKSAITAAVALGLGTGAAQATTFNMTFMDFTSGFADNPNVVGTANTTTGTGVFNSGITNFNGHAWTGTVTFGDETSGAGSWMYSMGTGASTTGTYTYTLGAGQVAMGVLFDWSTSMGIPVLNIMNADGSGVDIDSDGTFGTSMCCGPFAGSPVGFTGTVAAVPVPAAAWLLGSGLLGLVGVARRRKSS